MANAGGRTLSAAESAQFLAMFQRYCSNPRASPTQEGNTFFYCKTSDAGPATINVNHDEEIQPGNTPKQVIFVQPPSYQYIHNVALRGSPGNPQQTDIYVLPSTAEHQLQLQDTRTAQEAIKPSLYFLQNDQQPGIAPRPGGSQGGNLLPAPVAGGSSTAFQAGGSRPSSPPPNPSNPNVIGIDRYPQPQPQTQQPGGYSQAYGAPSALRNQRNLRGSHFTANAKYSIL